MFHLPPEPAIRLASTLAGRWRSPGLGALLGRCAELVLLPRCNGRGIWHTWTWQRSHSDPTAPCRVPPVPCTAACSDGRRKVQVLGSCEKPSLGARHCQALLVTTTVTEPHRAPQSPRLGPEIPATHVAPAQVVPQLPAFALLNCSNSPLKEFQRVSI